MHVQVEQKIQEYITKLQNCEQISSESTREPDVIPWRTFVNDHLFWPSPINSSISTPRMSYVELCGGMKFSCANLLSSEETPDGKVAFLLSFKAELLASQKNDCFISVDHQPGFHSLILV